MAKFALYILVTIITFYAMDGLNINGFFKKNEVVKSRIMYFLIALSIIYLVSNFIYDFINFKLI